MTNPWSPGLNATTGMKFTQICYKNNTLLISYPLSVKATDFSE